MFYHEAGSQAALALWKDSTNILLATRLTMVEMASVNAIRIRQGYIDLVKTQAVERQIAVGVFLGQLHIQLIKDNDFEQAEALLRKHGATHRLRSLDALHLAVALRLWRSGRIDRLATADAVMVDVGRLEGMDVWVPGD